MKNNKSNNKTNGHFDFDKHFDFDDFFDMSASKTKIVELQRLQMPVKKKLMHLISYMYFVNYIFETVKNKHGTIELTEAFYMDAMLLSGKHVIKNFDDIINGFTTQQYEYMVNLVS